MRAFKNEQWLSVLSKVYVVTVELTRVISIWVSLIQVWSVTLQNHTPVIVCTLVLHSPMCVSGASGAYSWLLCCKLSCSVFFPSEVWNKLSALLGTRGNYGKALENYFHWSDLACILTIKWAGYQPEWKPCSGFRLCLRPGQLAQVGSIPKLGSEGFVCRWE